MINYQLTGSIVLYKNDISVIKAIQSFLQSTLNTKLFLIDNSPTPELKGKLNSFIKDKSVEYIFNNENVGYGAGHNVAIRKIIDTSKYHLILNPDVYFEPNVLTDLYNYAENHKEIGHLTPKVFYPDGRLQYVCKLIPTPFNLIARLFPVALFKKYNERFELRVTGYNKIMEVPYLSGSFMFLRCFALKQIGLFDERFFMYPEDIDLTRRMHKKFKTVFYPYVSIIHEHTKSSFKNGRMFLMHAKNMIKYFNKWGWFFDKERTQVNTKILQQFN